MRRLAQFVRLLASRVSRLASVCLRLRASASVCVCICLRLRLSRVCVRLRLHLSASACICLACVSRLSASVHVKGSECVRLRLSRVCVCLASASVSHLSACVCLASVSRRSSCLASVRLRLSRVSRRSSCLASVSRLCASGVGRLVSRVSVLVNACGNWLILCRSSFKEFKRFFAIVILSYNVPMPKYPSHHLIYVFYHPMPIMPLY